MYSRGFQKGQFRGDFLDKVEIFKKNQKMKGKLLEKSSLTWKVVKVAKQIKYVKIARRILDQIDVNMLNNCRYQEREIYFLLYEFAER